MRRRILPSFVFLACPDNFQHVVLVLVLLFCSASIGESNSQRTPPLGVVKRGDIRGRVVADDGQRIRTATVLITPAGSYLGSPSTRKTMIDRDGEFAFTDLEEGAYSVVVRSPGYIQARLATVQSDPVYYRVGDSVLMTMTKGSVITGKVSGADGEPAIGINVRAIRIRDLDDRSGQVSDSLDLTTSAEADDQGRYRLYGLAPGVYIVAAGGLSAGPFASRKYAGRTMTYFPSVARRPFAQEVTVGPSAEVSGVDIRYRGEPGYTLSGRILGVSESNLGEFNAFAVLLLNHATGSLESTSFSLSQAGDSNFSINSVSDGDYDLIAQSRLSGEISNSSPRQVVVRGADVSGLELSVMKAGSVSGTVRLIGKGSQCESTDSSSLTETVITGRKDLTPDQSRFAVPDFLLSRNDASPDTQGQFAINGLQARVRYHIVTNLPNPAWYVRSIGLRPNSQAEESERDVSGSGIMVRPAEKLQGLTITLASNGASIRGHIRPSTETKRLPPRLQVFLAPAEESQANDPLRFFETIVRPDGSFSLSNLQPGRYWALVREASIDNTSVAPETRAGWNETTRAKLLRDATTANHGLELKPCQQSLEIVLYY